MSCLGNLLTDPILSCRYYSGDINKLSLPALFAALMADKVDDLPSLRPHQRQPMHSFLAQLGALALLRAGEAAPPDEPAAWATFLQDLTSDFTNDEPWTLIVDDVSKPALLQPPIPEGTLSALEKVEETPDAIDMLVTSRNHDVKARRLIHAEPEHWFAALLALQTMEGYSGKGKYGISRMNGGFASRPMVCLTPEGGVGARLRRDIRRMLDRRDETENEGYQKMGGKALLWLYPWDGKAGLRSDTLEPWYIEICRRVRLARASGQVVAHRAGSEAPRVEFPKEKNGVTGDPWTPVNLGSKAKGERALTIQGSGFNYQLVTELLDSKSFRPAPLQRWRQDDGSRGLSLVMAGLARGEGETAGFHERRIPVPSSALNLLGQPGDRFAEVARRRVEDAGVARRSVLRTALFMLFQNAPETLNQRHAPSETKSEPFLASFDRRIDAIFFESISCELEATPGDQAAARIRWLSELRGITHSTFEDAVAAVPLSGLRRYHTIERARSALVAAFDNRFFKEAAENS
jgi:CRISPR system Cascade subunit CasA